LFYRPIQSKAATAPNSKPAIGIAVAFAPPLETPEAFADADEVLDPVTLELEPVTVPVEVAEVIVEVVPFDVLVVKVEAVEVADPVAVYPARVLLADGAVPSIEN
jgi:hypothetical protein